MTRNKREFAALITVILTVCLAGCGRVSQLETSTESVELGGAESVRIELRMGAGELKISGRAKKLMEAEFTYPLEWKPEVRYAVTAGEGRLRVEQPHGPSGSLRGNRYVWDLLFNDAIPMELNITIGAGRSDLTLGSLMLKRLDIELGAGEANVDLTGHWKSSLSASIRGGVGTASVRLPSDVGVRVEAQAGIGTINAGGLKRNGDAYVNDAYGKSDVTLRISIQGGIGTINLELERAA